MSNRNTTTQIIRLKDADGNYTGEIKPIHHTKNVPNGDFKSFWNSLNQTPKKNSKRQKKLREQSALTV